MMVHKLLLRSTVALAAISLLVYFSVNSFPFNSVSGNRSYSLACLVGKEFYKTWIGDGIATVRSIVITNLNTSEVLYNGSLPAGKVIHLTIPHNTLLRITWMDWRGAQTETHKVECDDNVDQLTNTIPGVPKTKQAAKTSMCQQLLCP